MVFVVAALIFLISIAFLWWMICPQQVFICWDRCVGLLNRACRRFLNFSSKARFSVLRVVVTPLKSVCGYLFFYWRTYKALLVIGALSLSLPPVMVMLLRGPVMLEGYGGIGPVEGTDRTLIAGLLHGERLVPPAPLPPKVFTSVEVERIRPRVSAADRNWEKMDAEFMQRLLVVFRIMQERYGYEMALLEGYRSPQRQAALSSQVTNAGPGRSYHQYGLAADSAFLRDGRLLISEKDAWAMRGYELYGQVAEELGLTWGGRWKLQDYGHVELRRSGSGPHPRSW